MSWRISAKAGTAKVAGTSCLPIFQVPPNEYSVTIAVIIKFYIDLRKLWNERFRITCSSQAETILCNAKLYFLGRRRWSSQCISSSVMRKSPKLLIRGQFLSRWLSYIFATD
jgi:hypothetical protein